MVDVEGLERDVVKSLKSNGCQSGPFITVAFSVEAMSRMVLDGTSRRFKIKCSGGNKRGCDVPRDLRGPIWLS